MSAGLQSLVVALLLAWSLGVMLRRWFPAGTDALLARAADRAAAHGLATLARWLRPADTGSGCDSGCSRCRTGCNTPVATQPVQWRPSRQDR